MKIKGDAKLSEADKAAQIEKLQAEVKKQQAATEKAEASPFKVQVAAFVEADKAGDQAKLKKIIADFAAQTANAPTN